MENIYKIKTVCPRCGTAGEASAYPGINVGENPELKESVLNGSVFMWECPGCGESSLIRFPLLYHDPGTRLLLWLSDGKEETEKSMAAVVGSQTEGLGDYTTRIVDNPGDLIEKIKISDAGLDDVAVELCKYVARLELKKDVDLKFLEMEGADREITLTYPEKGEMQLIQIGFNVYEDSDAILRRNPVLREKASGFVRVDRSWIDQYLK